MGNFFFKKTPTVWEFQKTSILEGGPIYNIITMLKQSLPYQHTCTPVISSWIYLQMSTLKWWNLDLNSFASPIHCLCHKFSILSWRLCRINSKKFINIHNHSFDVKVLKHRCLHSETMFEHNFQLIYCVNFVISGTDYESNYSLRAQNIGHFDSLIKRTNLFLKGNNLIS